MASFGRDPRQVARLVRAEEVFSILHRQVSVPASCVALVWGPSGQASLVSAGRPIESSDVRELLLVRTAAFSADYDLDGLTSQDGYPFSASVRLLIEVVPDRAELAAFRESVLGSGNEVRVEDLRRHCKEAVHTALATFAGQHAAADLVSAVTWGAFDDLLAEHFKPVGFASGLALGPDPRVTFESTAFAESSRAEAADARRRQQAEADAQLRDMAAKAREKHLAELGGLLEQVKRMARENPHVAVADLIKTFDPARRGALYEGLVALHRPAVRTEAILVAAGEELIWLDPASLDRPSRRQDLTSSIGPLRSVRLACADNRPLLLVGARRGVHLVAVDGELHRTYAFETKTELRGGVNAAVLLSDTLYATHSEMGLLRWPRNGSDEHEACLSDITEGATTIRDVRTDDAGRLWFSADRRVVGWQPDRQEPPILLSTPATVTALAFADGFIFAGLDSGGIVRWVASDPVERENLRGATGHAVRSLGWISGGGMPRLLIADGRPLLDLQVLGDAYHGEYRCRHKLRWAFAAEDCIVGVNDRRDQLFTWCLDSPESPTASISIGRLCGHSIQDVALLQTGAAGTT